MANFRSADSVSSVFANKTTVASCLHRPQTPHTAAVMGENDESEIIEHHDDEEMEKMRTQRNQSQSFLESVASSEKDGYSSTQSSHRLLAYSDALISIIATVMVRKLTDRQPLDKRHGTFYTALNALESRSLGCTQSIYCMIKTCHDFSCVHRYWPVAHTKFQDNEVKIYIITPF